MIAKPMKKVITLSAFLFFSGASFCQTNVRQNLAKQINALFVSCIDSNLNEVINIDKLGTINILHKDKNETVDFNILDLSDIELVDNKKENPPVLGILFQCKHCMRLTATSADTKANFDNTTLMLPVLYKSLALKLVTKLEELQKENR